MESFDVMEKVSIPTPWVSSMVTIVLVKPNGTLRTCIYSQNLNKAIRYEHYLIQTIKQMVIRMPNATIFLYKVE